MNFEAQMQSSEVKAKLKAVNELHTKCNLHGHMMST